MTAYGPHPVRLPGGDLVVPGSWCAMLQEDLRTSRLPEMRELRAAALAIARDRTLRVKGSSGAGIPGVADQGRARPSSEHPDALTTRETAERLGVTSRNVVGLIGRGKLAGSWQDAEGRWWIPAKAVEVRQ